MPVAAAQVGDRTSVLNVASLVPPYPESEATKGISALAVALQASST